MQFLKTVQESVWGKAFYEKVRGEGAGQAVKYFLLLMASVAIITSLVLAVTVTVAWKSAPKLAEIQQMVANLYPHELVLTWKNGEVSSNVDEPYAILFPKEWLSHQDRKDDFPMAENLLVIDTSKSVDANDFERYDTMLILGKDSVGSRDARQGKVQIQNFSRYNFDDFQLDKEKVLSLVGMLFNFLKWVFLALLFALPLLIFVGLSLKYLVYLIFGALIIWLVAKLRKVDLTYGMAYKLGLYLLTLPILVNVLSNVVHILNAPFVFTLILAIVTYINLEPSVSTPAPVTPEVKPAENPAPKEASEVPNTPPLSAVSLDAEKPVAHPN